MINDLIEPADLIEINVSLGRADPFVCGYTNILEGGSPFPQPYLLGIVHLSLPLFLAGNFAYANWATANRLHSHLQYSP